MEARQSVESSTLSMAETKQHLFEELQRKEQQVRDQQHLFKEQQVRPVAPLRGDPEEGAAGERPAAPLRGAPEEGAAGERQVAPLRGAPEEGAAGERLVAPFEELQRKEQQVRDQQHLYDEQR